MPAMLMQIKNINEMFVNGQGGELRSSSSVLKGGDAQPPPAAHSVNVQTSPKERLTTDQLEAIVEEIQSNLDFMNTKIAFKVDKKSEEMVVEVMDKETGEVLKQIPPEEILKIRAAFKDLVRGMLVNAQA